MKKTGLIILLVIISFTTKGQNDFLERHAVQMLKEFYIARMSIKFIAKDSAEWNLIQKKYCTRKLRKEAKQWYDDGHDLFTNDWGIDISSLKTLTVVKESSIINTYVMSYIVITYPQSPAKPVMEHVNLHITLTKENGQLKISSVKDLTTRLI